MTTPASLFLVRHGEVETRYHRVFAGSRIDMELSPHGHTQAAALAQWLRSKKLHAIYHSPMQRVRQTLAPLLANNGHEAPIEMPGLREVDFGDWTGCNWAQVQEKFGVSAYNWLHEMERGGIPNGESAAAMRARVEPSVRRIVAAHPGQNVAVFCHGGVVRMILSILLELPLPKMAAFEIDYASLTHVELHPHKTEVQLLNFTPWRDLP